MYDASTFYSIFSELFFFFREVRFFSPVPMSGSSYSTYRWEEFLLDYQITTSFPSLSTSLVWLSSPSSPVAMNDPDLAGFFRPFGSREGF